MKKSSGDSVGIHTNLHEYFSNRNRVGYVRLSGLPFLVTMLLCGKDSGGGDFIFILIAVAYDVLDEFIYQILVWEIFHKSHAPCQRDLYRHRLMRNLSF